MIFFWFVLISIFLCVQQHYGDGMKALGSVGFLVSLGVGAIKHANEEMMGQVRDCTNVSMG